MALLLSQAINIVNCAYFEPHYISVFSNDYGLVPLFYISAFSGTIFVVFFSKILEKKSIILKYIGKNSIIFLGVHQIFYFIARFSENRFVVSDVMHIVLWLATFVISILIISLANNLIIKTKLKFIVGK